MSAALSRELLEARIEREREEFIETLADLRSQVRERTDLGERVRSHPTAWLAGAMVVGFLWGVRR